MAKNQRSFDQLPPAGKGTVGAGIVIFICAAYYFVFHASVINDLNAAQARRRQLEVHMEAARARNAEYLALREELAAREGLDRQNLRALPEAAETAAFLQDLNRLAELSGLRIRQVEPRPEEPDEHYVRLPVRLELAGRYHQLARFFHSVSHIDRLISMENLHLHHPEVVAEEVQLSVDVMATTYRRPSAPDEGEPMAGGGA